MNTFAFHKMIVDLSGMSIVAGLDASKWRGRIKISVPRSRFGGRMVLSDAVVMASWKGCEGAAEGRILDVEGEDEHACERVERHAEELSEEIARRLGDPCSREERASLDQIAAWFEEGGEKARRVA